MQRTHPRKRPYWRFETGGALVVSLVLLTLATLTGLTAMQVTLLQGHMANNTREQALALEAAEAALRAAAHQLTAIPGDQLLGQGNKTETTNGEVPGAPVQHTVGGFADLAHAPVYAMEYLPSTVGASQSLATDEAVQPVHRFRVTATGWGHSEHTIVRLQSVFRLN